MSWNSAAICNPIRKLLMQHKIQLNVMESSSSQHNQDIPYEFFVESDNQVWCIIFGLGIDN